MRTNVTKVDGQGHLPIPEEFRDRYHLTPGAELVWQDPGNGTLILDLEPKKTLGSVRAALAGECKPDSAAGISTKSAIETHIREKHKHAGG